MHLFRHTGPLGSNASDDFAWFPGFFVSEFLLQLPIMTNTHLRGETQRKRTTKPFRTRFPRRHAYCLCQKKGRRKTIRENVDITDNDISLDDKRLENKPQLCCRKEKRPIVKRKTFSRLVVYVLSLTAPSLKGILPAR